MDERQDKKTQTSEAKTLNPLLKILLVVILVIGFITTFASGFFLSKLFESEKNVTTQKTPSSTSQFPKIVKEPDVTSIPSSSPNPEVSQDTTKFLPGKHYFEDTIILVTKDKPQINLVATVTRAEQDSNYAQSTRVSYYDGKNWTRQSSSKAAKDSAIVSNNLVKSWVTDIDPSRVLKQTVKGEITINNSSITFSSYVLQNEIGMRSLPGYTKFMSNGTGTVAVNGVSRGAYILYTRIYSSNASDIQFYNDPFGLTTDWVVFWDTQGNFYHVDATSVDKPTTTYQTHKIGVMENSTGAVSKAFDLSIERGSKSPPEDYVISLFSPINAKLTVKRINGVNKAPNGSYIWYMGNIEGTVETQQGSIPGVGLVEYIHD